MTSRLDRLFSLLESCPNASLRSAAAKNLGELAQALPSNVESIFTRLTPLLRHRNWASRIAAADVLRSIVQHLPEWEPTVGDCTSDNLNHSTNTNDGFLSLSGLQLQSVLSQGARLYSMDARDLEHHSFATGGKRHRPEKLYDRALWELSDAVNENDVPSAHLQCSVPRQELNSRLGLNAGGDDGLLTSVLATHSNVSVSDWLDDDDLAGSRTCAEEPYAHLDVATCVRSTFPTDYAATAATGGGKKRKLSPPGDVPDTVASERQSTTTDRWPLDRLCTRLLGDLWAPCWETRHGAASGLRELLSDGRHTKQAGKCSGMSAAEMQTSHNRYLEDIVVRVLCTLALDQLSDFISDEVVAPVRETAAQLLGVLSQHLTEDQVLLVAGHLIYLVTEVSHQQSHPASHSCGSNAWMIVHGGLLGVKYLVASRKDLRPSLLPLVAPCLLSQLLTSAQPQSGSREHQQSGAGATPAWPGVAAQAADEDIRAAAASALLPVVDDCWIAGEASSVLRRGDGDGEGQPRRLLSDSLWPLLEEICVTANELSPAIGPLLQLVAALVRVEARLAANGDEGLSTEESPLSAYRLTQRVGIVLQLIHHVSSSIRLQALVCLACLLQAWQHRHASSPVSAGSNLEAAARTVSTDKFADLPLNILELVLDQLFHRIVLEPTENVRSAAVSLCNRLITSTRSTDLLMQACLPRLDYWLCQAMQPTGVPFAPHLMTVIPSGGLLLPPSMSTCQPAQHPTGLSVPAGRSHLDRRFYIGGSISATMTQPQLEDFVLNSRLCIIRLLAVLFARLCRCIKALPLQTDGPGVASSSTTTQALATLDAPREQLEEREKKLVENQSSPPQAPATTSMLAYFLDRILCRVHLTDRLAMQRFVAGILLSSWSLLPSSDVVGGDDGGGPSGASWGQRLALSSLSTNSTSTGAASATAAAVDRLAGSLRHRLECCLTEVVYYEEILGIFKIMQDDSRELTRVLLSTGSTESPLLSFRGVRTIAQSSELVQFALHHVQERQHSDSGSPPDLDGFGDLLVAAVDRARASVDRCLALQLNLSSRVELAISCALVNFDCLLPGRLSLLIRPLMDTVRCSHDQPVTAGTGTTAGKETLSVLRDRTSPPELPPTGSSAVLQRLAASALARLLHLEWTVRRGQLQLQSTDLTHVNSSRAAGKVVKNLTAALVDADPQLRRGPPPDDPVTNCCGNSAAAGLTNTGDAWSLENRPSWLECQQRGVSLALCSICSVFLSPHPGSLASLRCGLPGLWHSMWVDPVQAIAKLISSSSDGCPLATISHFVSSSQDAGNHISEAVEDVITSGLLLLSICLPVIISRLPAPGAESSSDAEPSFQSLVAVGVAASFLAASSSSASERTRISGCRLLTTLAILRPARLLNTLLPLLLPLLQNHQQQQPDALVAAALESLSTILERATGPAATPLVHCGQDPLQDLVPTSGASPVATTTITVLPPHGLSDALVGLIPFTVLLLPPVLRLLSDQDVQVRAQAGRLFSQLLTLLPFESSLPDPPEMDRTFRDARTEQRHFADSLLRPKQVELYNLPVTIRAQLRTYQQDGVNWLNFLNRYGLNGILCDDLGLGKTLQTICILAGSHHELASTAGVGQQKPVVQAGAKYDNGDRGQGQSSLPPASSSLVVCPPTLCSHWLHEVWQYAPLETLTPIVYAGSPSARQSLQTGLSSYTLVITSYDTIRIDAGFFTSVTWNYIVLDEGHIIKSSKSKVSRALKQLRGRHRLILTGTPIQNRVEELWSLFDFLMPDFLGEESEFVSRFSRPVAASRDPKASKAEQHAGMVALEKLHRLVLPFMLRRLKEDVLADLPPKIIQDFSCEMTPIQSMLYEGFTKSDEGRHLLACLSKRRPPAPPEEQDNGDTAGGNPFAASSALHLPRHGFQAIRYLQAICNHPCLALRPGHPALRAVKGRVRRELGSTAAASPLPAQVQQHMNSVHLSGKLLALCRLLTECGFGNPIWPASSPPAGVQSSSFSSSSFSGGSSTATLSSLSDGLDRGDSDGMLLSQHRALMFFQTREMLQLTEDMLRTHFPAITSTRLDGSVPVADRQKRVMRFNSDPSIDIMLLTTAVGGLGLNLTGADTVIFVEHDWNPSKDLQAMDRVHRIGQRRTVNVYRLITEDSVEEQIMNLQAFKLHLANTVVNAENQGLASMDTGRLFDRLDSTSGAAPSARQPGFETPAPLDTVEAAYETEYSLEAFMQRLGGCPASTGDDDGL